MLKYLEVMGIGKLFSNGSRRKNVSFTILATFLDARNYFKKLKKVSINSKKKVKQL